MDDFVIQVDVFPTQFCKLTRPRVEVDRKRNGAAPCKRHLLAREELQRLVREEELLLLSISTIRAAHTRRGVLFANTQSLQLGLA